MKKLDHKKGLSATVSMLMTLVVCQSVSVQASDIDIYSNATGGKTTITLMLDTSGSMSAVRMTDGSACELSPDTAYTLGEEPSGTTPPYTKYYCGVDDGQRKYYYRRMREQVSCGWWCTNTITTWYSCGVNGSANTSACTTLLASAPSTDSFDNDGGSNTRYYYKNGVIKYYDRLTRLKDAIFTLMDSNQIDSNSVAMGIGQFSSQSESNNVFTSADGTSGKIVVPAALLSTTQRTAIKTAVANLQGGGGTPTANAYAEVAAYMLGKNTTTNITGPSEDYIVNANNNNQYKACTMRGLSCVGLTSNSWTTGSPSGYTRQICSSISWTSGATTYCWTKSRTLSASDNVYSGFDKSVTSSKSSSNYSSPLSTTNTQCNGQGIYFLTDGNPNSSPVPVPLMQAALGSTGSSFSVPTTGTLPDGSESGNGMPAVGEFAKALRDKTKNPLGLEIKTAVVGFGSVFNVDRTADAARPVAQRVIRTLDYINSKGVRTNEQRDYYNCSLITNVDAQNACNWGAKPHPDLPSSVGGYGNGGFYSAQSTDDVVQSVVKFLDDVKPEFEPIATGSPTLPQDALNPLRIQPYGYYGSFTPKPQESTQLWVGNMNKYHIFNGELYNASKTIRLIKADGSLDAAAKGLWTDEGMKGQLPLGIGTNAANEQVANRTIYTNREITGTAAPYAASEIGSLKKVNVATLFGTGSTALFVNDPDKNYWLNLLGYNVAETGTVTLADLITKPELRQVGSVMHSTPILLTQSGKISYTSGTIDTTDRDDYLLFGSTQGLLHVVRAGKNATDANRGKEVFAFAPNEMMQNQKNAFLSETSSTLGKNNLFYGIDAPWTAYTQYVAKADGTLTVKDSGRVAQNASGDDIAIKGLQWVYGGLRMGGKSYYALNLSDLDNPELKFHIDPANSKIYKSSSTTTGVTALSYMGQSWSKPTIAYVNFGGVKKLVMFVGGGYDAGYENAAYDQNTTTGGGAGVYMFDANNGDLLWWTSANATAAGGAEAFTNASATSINMKYSVVSQINAIDRDSDGLVDNLYFGDLGGQGFRVDLNNAATGADASAKKANFAKRVVRLFDEHATGGASPRFYEMPSVSIHDSDNGYVAAVAFSSGNRSSPLVGAAGANQAGSNVSATDGVFVVYDKDVAKTDLYGTPTLTTPTALTSLNSNMSTGVAIAGNSGWKYTYSNTAGAYKGMNELYALDGMLYVNVFHRDGTGIGGACGAGVKGDSYVYQFCLPTGKCSFNTTTSGVPNSVKLGAGILGTGLGQGRSNGNTTGLIVNRPTTLNCTTTPNLPECQEFTTTAKLRQLRWYETR
ncbi:pilus assembly protein [Acinetobacter sp. AOR34_HL]|uniref:pilus assembly protein PilC n=1 Tax=Acinetobacter sp. AOR34_HL TaxID=2919384 RepID=UPI0022EACE11|nr:pilus assembly protein PilC [Acinetobacter sp. AOR34_HL]MDA3501757.1 pilus assembly protein [Acinetobacter sp. AOR34_HL]